MNPTKIGKVRDIYDLDAMILELGELELGDDVGKFEGKIVIVTSNRVSVFDEVLPILIPSKGQILNKLSEFWFNFTKDIIPNHFISTYDCDMPKEIQKINFRYNAMLVKKLKMLPIECIVRGYMAGSARKSYLKNGTIFGIKLPKGLQESEKLPRPIFTPTTKAEFGHDEPITFNEMAKLLGSIELALEVKRVSIKLYKRCAEYALTKGIIIADTKFEFGIDENGNLCLGDEILTPDSSRFWPLDKYEVGREQESFDKQYLRDWITENKWLEDRTKEIPHGVITGTALRYLDAYKMLTGESLNSL